MSEHERFLQKLQTRARFPTAPAAAGASHSQPQQQQQQQQTGAPTPTGAAATGRSGASDSASPIVALVATDSADDSHSVPSKAILSKLSDVLGKDQVRSRLHGAAALRTALGGAALHTAQRALRAAHPQTACAVMR